MGSDDMGNEQYDLSSPIILLSHSGKDRIYGDALEAFLRGLGIKNEQLIYTSHLLHKVPNDMNIFDYLRKNIKKNLYMIILWSNTYLDSPACLAELGAAWVVMCDYSNIYMPSFNFHNPKYSECPVDTKKMGIHLGVNSSMIQQGLLELKDKVDSYFTNREYREDMAKHLREKFYSEIQIDFLIFSAERWLNSTSKKKKDIDKNDFFDMYFLGCLNKSADMNAYLKIREPGKYNVLDYRIAAISFDGAIKGFLENHHPLSYAEIQRFYM